MKIEVGNRIRKLRESKDYSQENVAGELHISTSAYSKIERGMTDPSIGRLAEIAKILNVDVSYFLPQSTNRVEDRTGKYGYATMIEIEEINKQIRNISDEIESLKKKLEDRAGSKPRAKK